MTSGSPNSGANAGDAGRSTGASVTTVGGAACSKSGSDVEVWGRAAVAVLRVLYLRKRNHTFTSLINHSEAAYQQISSWLLNRANTAIVLAFPPNCAAVAFDIVFPRPTRNQRHKTASPTPSKRKQNCRVCKDANKKQPTDRNK